MNEFLIKIRAIFEGKGFSDAAKGAGEAGEKTGGFSSRLVNCIASATALGGVVGQLLVAAFQGFIGIVSSAIQTLSKFVEEFASSQEKIATLDAALAQSGKLTEEYRTKLQELAAQLQDTTAIADDEWFGVLQRLTQFGADETNIDQYAEAVKNLAGILGGDIQSASLLVSKAMQGNFAAFSRYGIVVDDAGSQTEKLNQLMEQLAARGGGVLDSKTKTINGQFRTLRNSTSDLLEAFGSLIARTGILQTALDLLTKAVKFLGGTVTEVQPKLDGLKNKLPEVGSAAREVERKFKNAAEGAEELGDASVKLDTSGVDRLKKSADALAESFANARKGSEALQRQQIALVDAQAALELAKIDASDEDELTKLEKKQEVQRRLAERKNKIEQEAEERRIAIAGQERDAAIKKDIEAFETAARKKKAAEEASGRVDEAQRRENKIKGYEEEIKAAERALKLAQEKKKEEDATIADLGEKGSQMVSQSHAVQRSRGEYTPEEEIGFQKNVIESLNKKIDANQGESVKDAQDRLQRLRKAALEAEEVSKAATENKNVVGKRAQQEIDETSRAGMLRNLVLPYQLETQLVKDRSETKKVSEKVQSEKDSKVLAEKVREQENRIRELELADAAPEKIAEEKSALVDLKTDKKATPEQLRAADLEKQALRQQAKEKADRERERLEKEGAHNIIGLSQEAEAEIGVNKGSVPKGKGGGQLQRHQMDQAKVRVEAARKNLQDGVDPGELDEMIASIEEFAQQAAAKGQAVDEKIGKLAQAVDVLKSQMKNGAGR